MRLFNSRIRVIISVFFIIAVIMLLFGIARLSNSDMQDKMREGELSQALLGLPINADLNTYFNISYGSIYIGIFIAFLSVYLVFYFQKNSIFNYSVLLKFTGFIFIVSLSIVIVSVIEINKPLNNLLILASKEGIVEISSYLKNILVIRNISFTCMIFSLVVLLLGILKNIIRKSNNANL